MKLLEGRDLAGFIQERHARIASGLQRRPVLAIIRVGEDRATDIYIRVKRAYGEAIGVEVREFRETPETLLERVKTANADPEITGIIVQFPLPSEELTVAALKLIATPKDVDGLNEASSFQPATPKAVQWLLAGYNIAMTGEIAVVGQGRLVGAPLATEFESSGLNVHRYDADTADLGSRLWSADIIIAATGTAGIIQSGMLKPGAVVVDAGSPKSELAQDVWDRQDLIVTPNPGGLGPMTVAALYDNLMIAAQNEA